MNYALVVNDAYVIRFDITGKIPLRFQSEVLAYEYLQTSEVPVPEVIALDQSKQLVPYEYLITSKLEGTSVIDSWNSLSAKEQERIAYEAGTYLALIHSYTFERFGKLRDLPNGGFTYWYDYCADYFHRYANQALAMNIIDPSLRDRMQAVLEKYRPLLDTVRKGYLLHSDYHFENILQRKGVVSGIIDFEWAYAGDADVDFVVEDVCEQMCPGSTPHMYAGYASVRPLDAHHDLKMAFYKLYMYLEFVVSSKQYEDEASFQRTYARLVEDLEAFERGE